MINYYDIFFGGEVLKLMDEVVFIVVICFS